MAGASGRAADGGFAGGIRLGIESSESESNFASHSEQVQNSAITGGGKVSLQAGSESGSLQARAVTVQGKEVSLSAHTLDLGAQETHASHTSRDQSSGWTAGVTYHGGMAFSYDASISMSEGRAEGQSTQQHNTHIRATEGVSFASTGGTSLKGARLEGETVKGQVGRNLTIESLQDTAESSAEQNSSGLNFSYGAQGTSNAGTNAGINFSQGNASGSYAVVTEQSGIAAGTGGFDIEVAGATHLKGGLIDSSASADKNSLSTGQLITQDIANHSEFSSSTFGLSLSYSSNPKETGNLGNGFNAMPDIPQFESRDDRSTTRSAIAAGSVKLTQGDQKENEQQLASLNRDVQAERNKKVLDPLPDLQRTLKSQADTAMAIRAAGPALYGMVGDIAQSRYEKAVADYDKAKASGDDQGMQQAQQEMQAWSEGGVGKIALHGAAGAMLGNVPGMIAAASNETLIPYLQQQAAEKYPYPEGADAQTRQNIDRQRGEYMLTASTVVGAVAGGAAGANVASTATKFNYLSHADRQKLKDAEKNCMHTGERSACDTAMTLKLQDEQTNAYVQSAVANCEGAQCAEVMNFLQRERTSLGCPASVVVVCQDAPTLNEAWKVASEKAQGLEPVYPESWLADGKLVWDAGKWVIGRAASSTVRNASGIAPTPRGWKLDRELTGGDLPVRTALDVPVYSPDGMARAATFGGNWSGGSLRETVELVTGKTPLVTYTESGKTIYKNPATGMSVVYDNSGNYYRVQNSSGKYLDQHGKEIPNNVYMIDSKGVRQTGLPSDIRNGLTHFLNTDPRR